MRSKLIIAVLAAVAVCGVYAIRAPGANPLPQSGGSVDAGKVLVGRLDLELYKATVKGLTQFGDRREGTARNRKAVDWIEAQLKSYGCANITRLKYDYKEPTGSASGIVPSGEGRLTYGPDGLPSSVGGGRPRGVVFPAGPNLDINKQPDPKIRALDAEVPVSGPREEVYCTKVGATDPGEMYILGAHMDGRGFGEAANDDGSGTALVMEIARILSDPNVQSQKTIRFALWNNEEGGVAGSAAYVAQRKDLQGKEDPPGSGKYPEPKWLGMIQHDMMLFDHGMPRADGTISKEQRPEADVNIEFQSNSKFAADSQGLAWEFEAANEKYATDYPAGVGNHMTNTDSGPFQNLVASISLRENQRGVEIGSGWDPQWHQPTDLYTTYNEKDFRLGLNAAQTTLAATIKLAGVTLKGSAGGSQ
jgi:peptidase M28-like protein